MGQQSIIGAVTMKYLVIPSLALAAASAIHIPKKYAHYKPGYMRIPGWEKIASGERKLNQKEPTMTFTPRKDFLVELKPDLISSHGKSDYSLMDISAVAASFP